MSALVTNRAIVPADATGTSARGAGRASFASGVDHPSPATANAFAMPIGKQLDIRRVGRSSLKGTR